MSEATRARYPNEQLELDRGGLAIAVDVYEGPEPTVLFCPRPTITNERSLKGVLPYISRHFRTVLVEGLGNGRSGRSADSAAHTPDALVADALAALDATDTDRAVIVSASSRAIVGLRICAEHPERALACVFVTPDLRPSDYIEELAREPADPSEEDAFFNFPHMRRDWEGFAVKWARAAFPHPHSTRQREDAEEHILSTDPETYIASLVGRGIPERKTTDVLAGQIRCPILVMKNGGLALGPKDTSDPLAAATGAQLHAFEGMGPLVPSRWPVVFNLALRRFLEEVRAAQPRPRAGHAEAPAR